MRSSAEPVVEMDDILRDALGDLLESESRYGAVVDSHGRVMGALSIEAISHGIQAADAAQARTGADALAS